MTSCKPLGWKLWVVLLLLASGLYVTTTQYGVSWQDSGEYQWRCITGDYLETIPAARSHPLYIFIGQTIRRCVGDAIFPFAINAFSGLMMGVGLATLAAVMARLDIRRGVIIGVWLTLLLAHAIWWLSTIAEVYTTSAAMLSLELYALIRLLQDKRPRWLLLLGLANGIHLSLHNVALLVLPVYLVAMVGFLYRHPTRLKILTTTLLVWIVGAVGFITILIIRTGQMGFVAGLSDCLVGHYGGNVLNLTSGSPNTQANLALMGLSLANALLPLGLLGIAVVIKKTGRQKGEWYLVVILVIEFCFLIRYNVPDQFTFALPTLICLGLLAAIGAQWACLCSPRWKRWTLAGLFLLAILQPAVLHLVKTFGKQAAHRPNHSAQRDEARYWIIPWKHNESSAEKWATAVMNNVPEGSIIYADNTTQYPLKLKNFLNPSVQVISYAPDYKEMLRRPDQVFCVSTRKPSPLAPWAMERISPDIKLFHVTKPKPPAVK